MVELCLLPAGVARDRLDRLFTALWLFIVSVSVHDAYLSLVYRNTLSEFEVNPIANALLWPGSNNVWLLIAAKAMGTILAASGLLVLFATRRQLGTIAVVAVAGFQFGLLLYLSIDRHVLTVLGFLTL
jgi:hypothetical protein